MVMSDVGDGDSSSSSFADWRILNVSPGEDAIIIKRRRRRVGCGWMLLRLAIVLSVVLLLSFLLHSPGHPCSLQIFSNPHASSLSSLDETLTSAAAAAAAAEYNDPPNTKTPVHLHLALTSAPSQVVIQFTTVEKGTPVAMYGKQKNNNNNDGEDQKVEGTSTTYSAQDLCGAPANSTEPGYFTSPGYLHTVVLDQLQPNTLYHYQVGIALGQGIVWSEDVYPFVSPPPTALATAQKRTVQQQVVLSPPPPPYSYIVYGDQGTPTENVASAWTALAISKQVSKGHREFLELQHQHYGTSATTSTSRGLKHHRRGHQHHHNDNHSNTTTILMLHAVHHIGGLALARGAAHRWDEWMSLVQLFAARVPLMIAVGSAEYDYHTHHGIAITSDKDPSGANQSYSPEWGNYGNDSGGECGVPVSKRFQMPSTTFRPPSSLSTSSSNKNQTTTADSTTTSSSSSNGVFWYSYDSGSWLHTIVLSSEHNLTIGSPQYDFLERDLQQVNRTMTPWVVLELHRPLYMNQALWADNNVGLELRRSLEPLLHHYQVDLVLSGHYTSSYFRSCPGLFQSQCHNGGPTHITLGTGGAATPNNRTADTDEWYQASWATKTMQNVFGYGRITIYNSSALEFKWIQVNKTTTPTRTSSTNKDDDDDDDEEVALDQYWMFKE
jgi:hypothetical protein